MRLSTRYRESGYRGTHRLLEIAGITLFLGVLLLLTLRMVLAIRGPVDLIGVTLACAAGLVLADLISGLVHWAGDTLFTPAAPLVGRHFIGPFRQHHSNPKDITAHDFVETNGNNCLITVPVLSVTMAVMPEETSLGFYLCALIVSTSWFVFGTNQFHKWAHQAHPPRLAARLQTWGLILSPDHHDIHHASPHDTHYCITNGWCNPLLARLQLFRRIERLLARVCPGVLHLEGRGQPRATDSSLASLPSLAPAQAPIASAAAAGQSALS